MLSGIVSFFFNNLIMFLTALVLISFVIMYRASVKEGLSLFWRSLIFIFRYPAVLSFTVLRLVLFALLDIAIFAWFFPTMGWQSFLIQPIQRLLGVFQHMCLPVLPCGFIIVFLFLLVGFLVSIATIHYVLARITNKNESWQYSINFSIFNTPQIIIWSALYAPVYYGILTKQLFLLPLMLLLTVFVTLAIAKGSKNIGNTLIKAVTVMQLNLGQTLVFGLIFGLIALLNGIAIIQGYRYLSILCYCNLAILVTIRDIFKALVSPQD